MVTSFYPPYHFGGDATYVYRLANALAERGHAVDVIHDRDAYYLAHPGEPNSRFENHPNVRVYGLKSRAGPLAPLAAQQTGRPFFNGAFRRLLEANDYDVIHYHNVSSTGPDVFRYGRGIKLLTLHEHWLVCPMHVLWKFNREVCAHRQCLLCTLHGRRPPQFWRYTGLLKNRLQELDRVISPSRFTRDRHQELALDPPITVLPYFVPEPPAANGDDSPPHPRPYFLFVGRLEKIKGVQTLLPVFKQYRQADLVIAGEGEYGDVLRAAARDLPNVRFVGAQQDGLAGLYRHAIAVLVPSICYEVYPNVTLEAFSYGTPVIARDLGGTPEAVQDSGGGLLFRTESELAAALVCLQEDAGLRASLAEKGRRAFLRMWSAEPHLERYFEIIEQARRARSTKT